MRGGGGCLKRKRERDKRWEMGQWRRERDKRWEKGALRRRRREIRGWRSIKKGRGREKGRGIKGGRRVFEEGEEGER